MSTDKRQGVFPVASKCLVATLLWAGLAGTAALGQTAGSIAGTLTGEDGKSLAATITAMRTTPPAAGGSVQAAANGSFSLTNLPAGTYTLCAAVSSLGYIDPCVWSAQPPTVTLTEANGVDGVKLVVKPGVRLKVRLDDPDKVFANASKGKAPRMLLGIFTPRHLFIDLEHVGSDANGRNYEVLVPTDHVGLSVYVNARDVTIIEPRGTQVASSGKSIGVAAGAGKAPDVITLTARDPKKAQ